MKSRKSWCSFNPIHVWTEKYPYLDSSTASDSTPSSVLITNFLPEPRTWVSCELHGDWWEQCHPIVTWPQASSLCSQLMKAFLANAFALGHLALVQEFKFKWHNSPSHCSLIMALLPKNNHKRPRVLFCYSWLECWLGQPALNTSIASEKCIKLLNECTLQHC